MKDLRMKVVGAYRNFDLGLTQELLLDLLSNKK